jgi:hypothetical protein
MFRLFHALSRHPLLLPNLTANAPLMFRPTLLLSAPISAKAGELWRAANYRNAFISGPEVRCAISVIAFKMLFARQLSAANGRRTISRAFARTGHR